MTHFIVAFICIQAAMCYVFLCLQYNAAMHICFTVSLCLTHRSLVPALSAIQYIPRNMHTVFALLCFVVVIYWLIFPYPSGLLHWHCGNLTIAPVPAKQPWWIWINTSCEFIMNDCITTTKQSTTKPCAYFLGYTVRCRSGSTLVQVMVFVWLKQDITSSSIDLLSVRRLKKHDDVIKWKHFPRNWLFVRGIHRSRWIPHTKASDADLWCFLWSGSE